MYAWLFKSATGGLEKNLFRPALGVPKPRISDTQILVEVYTMALNPADYKVPELGLVSRLLVPSPSIPGMDFCGKVTEIGAKVDWMSIGEMVFGTMTNNPGQGSLAQYVAVGREMCESLPRGVTSDDAAGIGCAGVTALQSIKGNVNKGDKIFINGGSGGTGVWGIQIAKTLGCHVTTSCSTTNIDLCKELGADEVLDYRTGDIVRLLEEKGQIFSLVIDNVGSPSNLYEASTAFLEPDGKFVQVGMGVGFNSAMQLVRRMFCPAFLGGGMRKYSLTLVKHKSEDLAQLATWVTDGNIRPVTDEVFAFEDAPKAFEKLKTGRAKGKIVVRVSNMNSAK